MADPYQVLGIPLEATDELIRRRYLELIREFPPEQNPARFAAIRAAYERVKDVYARAQYWFIDVGSEDSIDAIIKEIACPMPRPRFGLKQLLNATKPPSH